MTTNGKVPNGINAKVVDLTPALAEQLLGRNTHNRNIRTAHVKKLAGAMKRGEWTFNGEALKVAEDGTILDGQHRILAVIEADVTVQVLIIENVPKEAQDTMDTGRARTLGDTLKLNGETDSPDLAAALRMLYAYEQTGLPSVIGNVNPTIRECVELLDRHPGIRESVRYAGSKSKYHANKLIVKSQVAGLHYIFAVAQNEEDATRFFDLLGSGEGLIIGDPIHTLRERLLDDLHNKAGRANRLGVKQKLAFIVRAYNGWLDGEHLTRLMWRAGGAHPDEFPRVKGWEIKTSDLDAVVEAEAQAA